MRRAQRNFIGTMRKIENARVKWYGLETQTEMALRRSFEQTENENLRAVVLFLRSSSKL